MKRAVKKEKNKQKITFFKEGSEERKKQTINNFLYHHQN